MKSLIIFLALWAIKFGYGKPNNDENFVRAMKNLLFGENESQNPLLANITGRLNMDVAKPGLLPVPNSFQSMPSQSFPQPQPIPQITASASFGSYPYMSVSTSGTPCSLPQQIGTGPYRIPRWYFNPARMRCELFYWSGCCGNGNNFPNFQACQQVCEVDPCSQDRDQGVGALQLPRYYYNKETKLCEQFIYFGSGGNRNNFMTVEECQNQCPESPNPCAYGTPTTIIQCASGSVMTQTCTGQQFCHVGASPQTTICCNKPTNVDRCQQPLNVGIGNANLQRWYYNPLSQQCQTCVYRGLQGNENNFLSRSDCENSCTVNPCARGMPYKGQGVTVQCSTSNQAVCPAGYYCHFGADTQTTVCCQALGGDPCGQPMDRGRGTSQLPRWYWDQAQQKCLPFTYCGQKGTQNNFLTQQDCERTCFVFVNPCTVNIPLPPETCTPNNQQTCTPGSWCHIGSGPDTTLCCPNAIENICVLPLTRGEGSANLERWYYDSNSFTCIPFIYAGLKGNQNNFLTRENCERTCAPNPCPDGSPFIGADGKQQSCSSSSSMNSCPTSFWCHIGNEQSTMVCCPGAVTNPCLLPMSTGEGNSNLERFYFDQNSKSCKPFTYAGLKGNQNNFLSLRACQLQCQPLDNPCIGQPATTPTGQVLFCSATNRDVCPVNFWCHLGAVPETTVCCPGPTNPCSVPLAPGTGNAGIQRYYYNPDDRECVPFQYNGKRGNQNNFLTQAECARTCPEQLCLLSIDRGACAGRQTRYAFNRQSNQCVPFEYTGCGGNLNNFQTMADCMGTCGNIGFRRR